MQISKLKGPSFHCQKFVDQKHLPCSRTLLELSKAIIKEDNFSG